MKTTQKIKFILQGQYESFTNYEIRLEKEVNDIIKKEKVEGNRIIPLPTSDSHGRINTLLTWVENENENNNESK